MLTYLSEYLHAKSTRYWYIPSRYIDDKRVLQSDSKRALWPITCEAEFPRYEFSKGKHRIVRPFIIDYFQQKKQISRKTQENSILGPF